MYICRALEIQYICAPSLLRFCSSEHGHELAYLSTASHMAPVRGNASCYSSNFTAEDPDVDVDVANAP